MINFHAQQNYRLLYRYYCVISVKPIVYDKNSTLLHGTTRWIKECLTSSHSITIGYAIGNPQYIIFNPKVHLHHLPLYWPDAIFIKICYQFEHKSLINSLHIYLHKLHSFTELNSFNIVSTNIQRRSI